MYIYIYIADMLFEYRQNYFGWPNGVSHFASLQVLKMFIFFSSHFVLGGMASAWEGLLRITALSFLT